MAFIYFVGACLHLMDVLSLRLNLNSLPGVWTIWIWFLLVGDLSAAIGLWKLKSWGIYLFLMIASFQLVAYVGFPSTFGSQRELIAFHLVSLAIYAALKIRVRLNALKRDSTSRNDDSLVQK